MQTHEGKPLKKLEILFQQKKSKNLTKQILVDSLYERIGDHSFGKFKYPMITFYSRRECRSIIEETLKLIKETLENEEDVLISGFGKSLSFKRKKNA